MLNNAYCQSLPDTVSPKNRLFQEWCVSQVYFAINTHAFYRHINIVVDLVWSPGDKFPSYVGDKVCCQCGISGVDFLCQ